MEKGATLPLSISEIALPYALAKSLGEPLLATGNDFPLTDIKMCK